MLAFAILVRISLLFYAPIPHGYVYDFYAEAIYHLINTGSLPTAEDCFICYHPPLFPIVGAIIFKIVGFFGGSSDLQHYFVGGFTVFMSVIFSIFAYAIYKLFHNEKSPTDFFIWSLILFIPVVFISAFSLESDLFVATLSIISIYFICVFQQQKCYRPLIWAAVFAGLAASTKYSGLVICVAIGAYLLFQFIINRSRQNLFFGLTFGMLAIVFGGYSYVTNYVKYGTPFKGNDAWHTTSYHWGLYTYTDFSINNIVKLIENDTPEMRLGDFPTYNSSVTSSLYGQLWTDMSFYSNKYRHGHPIRRYKDKSIPITVVKGVLWFGLIPMLFSILGIKKTLLAPLAPLYLLYAGLSLGIYVEWYYGFHIWMLKTKYLMFLLPLWFISIGYGIKYVNNKIAISLLLPSIVFSMLYCIFFAVT